MQIRDLKKGDYVLTKQLGMPVKSKLLESPIQGKKVKKDNNWINVEVQDIPIVNIDRHNNQNMIGVCNVSHETFINKENKMVKLYNMVFKSIVITERVKEGLENGTITDEEVYTVIEQKKLTQYVDIAEAYGDTQAEDIDITLNSIEDMREKRGFQLQDIPIADIDRHNNINLIEFKYDKEQ